MISHKIMFSSLNFIQTLPLTNSLHHSSISPFPKITKHKRTHCSSSDMATRTIPPSEEVAQDFSPFLKIYKDGHIERIIDIDIVPPSLDPATGVESKDVVISPETGISARLYVPTKNSSGQKLPLVIYFHGGGFCVATPFCAKYDRAVKTLVAKANVIAVSVDYRLAPENPIPIPYDDSWAAVAWAAAHATGTGPEAWLNERVDFRCVFFAGDSAGANIAHNAALRVGKDGFGSDGAELVGIVLVHPYFWGKEAVRGEPKEAEKRAMVEGIWRFVYPESVAGSDDPWMNPANDPDLGRVGCGRVLVCVAEKDGLRDRGWFYAEALEKSGWVGTVEVVEAAGDDHVFHLSDPASDNAVALVEKIASFINNE